MVFLWFFYGFPMTGIHQRVHNNVESSRLESLHRAAELLGLGGFLKGRSILGDPVTVTTKMARKVSRALWISMEYEYLWWYVWNMYDIMIWLVVDFQPLWTIWKSIGMSIPNIWKINIMFQTTNQYLSVWILSPIKKMEKRSKPPARNQKLAEKLMVGMPNF